MFDIRRALGGRKCLCHFTYASLLPDIGASGGLLCTDQRITPPAHSWGANAKAGAGYVCTSLRPNWGILGSMGGREAALLVIDLQIALAAGEYRCVPLNSGSPDARRYIGGEVALEEAASACQRNPMKAEVLIAGAVAVEAIRGVMFHSEASRDHWWPAFRQSTASGNCRFDLSGWYDGEPGSPSGFEFPRDYQPQAGDRSNADGVDRSLRPIVLNAALHARAPILTIEDVERDFADEWAEDDPDDRDLETELLAERDAIAQEMADLHDSGWYSDQH